MVLFRFDTVYLDDEIRVVKDIRGDYLVVERAPYTWKEWRRKLFAVISLFLLVTQCEFTYSKPTINVFFLLQNVTTSLLVVLQILSFCITLVFTLEYVVLFIEFCIFHQSTALSISHFFKVWLGVKHTVRCIWISLSRAYTRGIYL